MTALIIAEHDNHHVTAATYPTVTCGLQLAEKVELFVAGFHCQQVAEEAAQIAGVSKVLVADAVEYQHFLAENLAQLIVEQANRYTYILAPATTFGKNLLPRVAALLDVAQVSDVITVKSCDTFVRPIYAGNALATVQLHDEIKVLTVRSTAFKAAATSTEKAQLEQVTAVIPSANSQFVKLEQTPRDRPDLTTARVVISGGRGLQSAENFKLLEKLADQLNAAIGASRAAVDAGFVPNDYQVGQTGKIVAPDLYIAIGISGAIQHLAGMKDSKIVVAINKDPDAPIFSVANYGIVGDLFQIVPELTQALEKMK